MSDYNCNCIEGVRCDVSECVHHSGANKCTANCICVECKEASDGKKTCCGTFEARS